MCVSWVLEEREKGVNLGETRAIYWKELHALTPFLEIDLTAVKHMYRKVHKSKVYSSIVVVPSFSLHPLHKLQLKTKNPFDF